MGKIWRFLSGEVTYRFPESETVSILETLRHHGVFYNSFKRDAESCEVTVTFWKRRLMKQLFGGGESVPTVRWHGVPEILRRYRKRIAIPLGLLFLCFIIHFSSQFIWCFEITGNTSVSDEEIIAGLTELGCGIGARIGDLVMDAVENEFVLRSDSVSWISVNIKGTTARVEVRELLRGDKEVHESVCANVVAGEPGEIVYVEVSEGQKVVTSGKSVKAGELLISGVVESKNGETRFEYASGKVMAKVMRTIAVEIKTEVEEKVYTGKEIIRKSANIFGKKINLFGNTGKVPTVCDMIVIDETVSFFREAPLPLTVTTFLYREYRLERKTITEKEAVAIGMAELRQRLDEALADAELLEKTVSAGFTDGVYRIECQLYVLTDIACTQEISVDQNGEEYGTEGNQRSE